MRQAETAAPSYDAMERGGKRTPEPLPELTTAYSRPFALWGHVPFVGCKPVAQSATGGQFRPRPPVAEGWTAAQDFRRLHHSSGNAEPVSNWKVLPFAVTSICDPLRRTATRLFQSSPSRLTAEPETILP